MNEQDKADARAFIANAHRWLAYLSECVEDGTAYEVRWHSSNGEPRSPRTSFMRIEYDYGPSGENECDPLPTPCRFTFANAAYCAALPSDRIHHSQTHPAYHQYQAGVAAPSTGEGGDDA